MWNCHTRIRWFCCLATYFLCTTLLADDPEWAFLQNDDIKIGLKLESGGAIGWVSRTKTNINFVNHHDRGRLIQQSYYGRKDGSNWAGKPWRWNPVQGGDYQGRPAKILDLKRSPEELYVKTQPRNWAGGNMIPEVEFEQWITLDGPVAHVRFKMTYLGKETHPVHNQEIPAVFVNRMFHTLVTEENGELVRRQPGFPNERYPIAKHWAAYVNDDDIGLGVLVPEADHITCYRFGNLGQRGACSYFAPITDFAIQPGFAFEYSCYLMIGKSPDIRERFENLLEQR